MILTPCWCEAFGFWLVGIHPLAEFSPKIDQTAINSARWTKATACSASAPLETSFQIVIVGERYMAIVLKPSGYDAGCNAQGIGKCTD